MVVANVMKCKGVYWLVIEVKTTVSKVVVNVVKMANLVVVVNVVKMRR